jgi:hypothetical protein
MDNYYKKKADKYKYKYLKLKNRIEYIGGDGELSFLVEQDLKTHEYRCTETCKKNNNVNSLVYKMGIKSDKLKKCIEDCQNEVKKLREKKIDEKKEADKKLKELLEELDRKEQKKIDEDYKALVEAKAKAEINKMSDEDRKRLENRKALSEYLDKKLNYDYFK